VQLLVPYEHVNVSRVRVRVIGLGVGDLDCNDPEELTGCGVGSSSAASLLELSLRRTRWVAGGAAACFSSLMLALGGLENSRLGQKIISQVIRRGEKQGVDGKGGGGRKMDVA